MKSRYQLRFFFDPGSGTCLWSANDRTAQAFGYTVDPRDLPLTTETVAALDRLAAWFDKSIDWEYPPDSRPWPHPECDRFNAAGDALLQALRSELGEGFEVHDERDDVCEDPRPTQRLEQPVATRTSPG